MRIGDRKRWGEQSFLLAADHFVPLFGLTPKLGPLANWGLQLDKSAIEVNTT